MPEPHYPTTTPRVRLVLVDTALAVAYAVVTVIGTSAASILEGTWPSRVDDVVALIETLTAAVMLVFRRHHPWLLFGTMWAVALVGSWVAGGLDPFGIALALYTLAVHLSRAAAWWAFAGTVSGYVLVALASALPIVPEDAGVRTASPVFLLLVLVAVLIGVTVDERRQRIAALIERADQLEREREQEAALIAATERARIAREMHDVVAHGVSVMVSLADGADAVAVQDPVRARATIMQVADTGRLTLAEMRRVLTVIGDDDAGTRPSPVLADLPALIASYRDAGLPVRLHEEGAREASPSAQATAYRIVQEGLTNALRYADRPTEVTVDVEHADGLTITVTDDGQPHQRRRSVGSGRGLVGIEERAKLWGGSVSSGPLQGSMPGGWVIRATLPDAAVERLETQTSQTTATRDRTDHQ